MKKFFVFSILLAVLPFTIAAQTDDLYFVPKKKAKKEVKTTETVTQQRDTYYSGSDRSVEEYNRLGSYYEDLSADTVGIDSLLSDVIDFDAAKGVYPDSLDTEDFELTKKMQRFDDYDISDNAAFWAGYEAGRSTWGWHSPWYYRTYGWYGGWYDPWYYRTGWYGWYGGWYDPWYYSWYDPWYYGYYGWGYPYRYGWAGYYGWGYPYYYGGGGGHYYAHNGTTGTNNHGRINYGGPRGISNGRTTVHSGGTFGGSAISRTGRTRIGSGSSGQSRLDARNTNYGNSGSRRVTNSSGTFGGNRRSSGSYSGNTSRSSGSYSSGSSSSGGSFGGSRSGGSTIGGSRSGGGGGGGSFGGRRR